MADSTGLYINVGSNTDKIFYYNMQAVVNENVRQAIGEELYNKLPMNYKIQGNLPIEPTNKRGPGSSGMLILPSNNNSSMEFGVASQMDGILVEVSTTIAKLVLERAVYYCPKDTGYLASTGRVENLGNGRSQVIFDCKYAWYVHEFTWNKHRFPECAKFLTKAVSEILGVQ